MNMSTDTLHYIILIKNMPKCCTIHVHMNIEKIVSKRLGCLHALMHACSFEKQLLYRSHTQEISDPVMNVIVFFSYLSSNDFSAMYLWLPIRLAQYHLIRAEGRSAFRVRKSSTMSQHSHQHILHI
jgi:hypothetical protein